MKTTTKMANELAVGDELVRTYHYLKPTTRLFTLENVAVVKDTKGRTRVQAKSGALTFQFRLDDQVTVVTDA